MVVLVGRRHRRARPRSAGSSRSPPPPRRCPRSRSATRAPTPRCWPPTARAWASSRPTTCAARSAATRSRRSLKDATVAIEDERFYKHKGVDYEGIVRAAVKNFSQQEDGAGRLDAHDAARPQPLHRPTARCGPTATSARSARRSSPRSSRTSTRRTWILEKYLNTRPVRHGRRPDRDRRRGGRPDLLQQARAST